MILAISQFSHNPLPSLTANTVKNMKFTQMEHLFFFQMLSTKLLPLACLSVGPNIITQRGVPVPEEREAIMIIAMMRRKRSATVRIVDLAVTHKTHNNSNKQTTSSLRVCVCIFDVSSIATTTTIIHSVKISKDRIAKLII